MTEEGRLAAPQRRRSRTVELLGWTFLVSLLAALILAALIHDRAGWPGFADGEATPVMLAESLIRDGDLTYARQDFDRFLLSRHGNPADLELASGSRGRRMTFDAPFFYALWIAPFLAVWPSQGFAVANAVLLAWVSLFAALTLRRGGHRGAPWLAALLVFASALFAETFRATGGLFFFAVTLAAFCLLARARQRARAPGTRYLLFAGALLAIPAATEPLLGVLFAGALWAVPPAKRGTSRIPLVLGAVALLAAIAGVRWLAGAGPPWAGEEFRFTAATGYPLVDFPASEWPRAPAGESAGPAGPPPWDVELRIWSLVDLLLGRSIGVLPYFAPLLVIVLGGSLRGSRRALVISVATFMSLVVLLRPFDVTGGAGLANGLFLPVYGALWWVLDSRREPWRVGLGAVLGLGLSALFLAELWRAPGALSSVAGPASGHVTVAAEKLLPFETTQRRSVGSGAVVQGDLAVRVLDGDVWAETRRGRWMLAGDRAELLIGSPRPVTAILLDFEKRVPEQLEVRGGKIDGSPGGGEPAVADPATVRVEPRGLRRRHPAPWSLRRLTFYRLTLALPEPVKPLAFRLTGEPAGPRAAAEAGPEDRRNHVGP